MQHSIRIIAFVATAMLATACSHKDRMKPITEAYEKGDYAAAANALAPLLESRLDSEKDRTLYQLEAGMVYSAAGDTKQSAEAWRDADERMWPYLDESPEVSISEQAAAIMTNQTIIKYRGRSYDRIMCCTYQGLSHMMEGDLEKSGVDFRRALEWQRDAVDRNAKEIEGLQKKAEEDASQKGYDSNRAMDDQRFKSGLDSAYGPLNELHGYGEYEIPYATFLRGLLLQVQGGSDTLEQATVSYRRVAGMLPEADRAMVEADAILAEQVTAGSAKMPSMAYVFCESGMGPRLDEFRLDIPLFMRQVPYVGAAFPVIKFNGGAPGPFRLRAGDKSATAMLLTDMDRVVGDEFKQRLPAIITMTLVSSATKAVATYLAQEAMQSRGDGMSAFVAIMGAIYQVATNSADLRIWLTLPKHVYYARLEVPESGTLEIDLDDGKHIGPIQLESAGTTVVHIRAPGIGAPPAVRTMHFPTAG